MTNSQITNQRLSVRLLVQVRRALAISFLILISSCETTSDSGKPTDVVEQAVQTPPVAEVLGHKQSGVITPSASVDYESGQEYVAPNEIFRGTGAFINAGRDNNSVGADEGEVTLNFQDTPVTEVVKTILGDILGVNYTISDGVSGSVSMRTTRAIPRDALVSVLDNLLRMNGAAIIKNPNYYEVMSIEDTRSSGMALGARMSADQGYQVQVVPLSYIGAKAMAKILEPVKSGTAMIMVDEYRNILTVAGSQGEVFNIRDTITTFDVNQLQGMSVGLFRIRNTEAVTLLGELQAIFGDSAEGPLAGMVRFMVIERLNALMVITPQERYLTDADVWIKRLDRAENPHGTNLYVYYVQNSEAEHLADLLSQLFESRRKGAVASALQDGATIARPSLLAADKLAEGGGERADGRARASTNQAGTISIIPDTETNALAILTTPAIYVDVEKALQKLDLPPMQVLVEASIVEVTLGNELEYGLQWFFKGSPGKYNSVGGLNIPASGDVSGGLAGVLPDPVNFTYAVFDAAGTRAVLNAIAGDSRIDVLSSPSLMVLDNQTASIRVGDQVPILTSSTTNTSSTVVDDDGGLSSNITNSIQYRDTGVSLEVTPRVNAGGMVIMDITQKVDDVTETTSSSIDSPTILQREITTSVAVQSGETIVLGGLIREDEEVTDQGVPFLKDIPILGLLFKNERIAKRKTELVVMITPSAVANPVESRKVTEEYKSKLRGIDWTTIR
ncbi:MAG: type II secretion system protein GspD [Gammaproteobacteria bacterium]|nr:MAG: type II secretion system protein GspD [Gammaproteobacteria bacterium]